MAIWYAASTTHGTNPGASGNPGTFAEPFRIKDAWSNPSVQPGDTVKVFGGRMADSNSDHLSETVSVGRSGTSGNPITWEAEDPNNPPIMVRASYFASGTWVSYVDFKDMHWLSLKGDYGIRATSNPASDLRFYRCHFSQEKYNAGGLDQKGWLIYFTNCDRLYFEDCDIGSWWGGEHDTCKITRCDDFTWIGGDWSKARAGHGVLNLINTQRYHVKDIVAHNVWNRVFNFIHDNDLSEELKDGCLERCALISSNWPYDRGEVTGNGDFPEDAARYDDAVPPETMGSQQDIRLGGKRSIVRNCLGVGHNVAKSYASITEPDAFLNFFFDTDNLLFQDLRIYHNVFHLSRANTAADGASIISVTMKAGMDTSLLSTERMYFMNNILSAPDTSVPIFIVGNEALSTPDHLNNWRWTNNLWADANKTSVYRDNSSVGDPEYTVAAAEAAFPTLWTGNLYLAARPEFVSLDDQIITDIDASEVITQGPNGPTTFQLSGYTYLLGTTGYELDDLLGQYLLKPSAMVGVGASAPLTLVTQTEASPVLTIQVEDGQVFWPGNFYSSGDRVLIGGNIYTVTARGPTSITLDSAVTVVDTEELWLAATGVDSDIGLFPLTEPGAPGGGGGDISATIGITSGSSGAVDRNRKVSSTSASTLTPSASTIAPGDWHDWEVITEKLHPFSSHFDTDVLPVYDYEYRVIAVDRSGNEATASTAVGAIVTERPRLIRKEQSLRTRIAIAGQTLNRRLI